jgi:hypothetical protein
MVIRETPYRISSEILIPANPLFPYKCLHKEVIDNIAFSDQERFSSESRSWLLGADFSTILPSSREELPPTGSPETAQWLRPSGRCLGLNMKSVSGLTGRQNTHSRPKPTVVRERLHALKSPCPVQP